jgi:hypothetical protein
MRFHQWCLMVVVGFLGCTLLTWGITSWRDGCSIGLADAAKLNGVGLAALGALGGLGRDAVQDADSRLVAAGAAPSDSNSGIRLAVCSRRGVRGHVGSARAQASGSAQGGSANVDAAGSNGCGRHGPGQDSSGRDHGGRGSTIDTGLPVAGWPCGDADAGKRRAAARRVHANCPWGQRLGRLFARHGDAARRQSSPAVGEPKPRQNLQSRWSTWTWPIRTCSSAPTQSSVCAPSTCGRWGGPVRSTSCRPTRSAGRAATGRPIVAT